MVAIRMLQIQHTGGNQLLRDVKKGLKTATFQQFPRWPKRKDGTTGDGFDTCAPLPDTWHNHDHHVED